MLNDDVQNNLSFCLFIQEPFKINQLVKLRKWCQHNHQNEKDCQINIITKTTCLKMQQTVC